jgi:hypothetical protein
VALLQIESPIWKCFENHLADPEQKRVRVGIKLGKYAKSGKDLEMETFGAF